jgi:hypothetical protein
MNMPYPALRSLAVSLTGAVWLLVVAWPMGAGADIVPNRPGAEQPTKPDRGIVSNRPCAASVTPSANCKPGFVWRLAGPEDRICVHPDSRARAALDNADAPNNVDPDGACAKDSDGGRLVRRKAFPGDEVCVAREIRALVRSENQLAASRRACN